jgi:hypothetical protein
LHTIRGLNQTGEVIDECREHIRPKSKSRGTGSFDAAIWPAVEAIAAKSARPAATIV